MAEHGEEEGFLDELIDMLVNKPFERFPLLNQPIIPSEEEPQGSFSDRLFKDFQIEQLFMDQGAMDIGNQIVLSEILKQLNELPSDTANFDLELQNDPGLVDIMPRKSPEAFPSTDIFRFFGGEINQLPTSSFERFEKRERDVFGLSI